MDFFAMEDIADIYGPDPETMTDILEDSNFILKVTPHERILISPSSKDVEGYQLFCSGIPLHIFEDRIIRLFDKNLKRTIQVLLPMNPSIDKHYGHAFITCLQKEYAEEAVRKLNGYEIEPNMKLTVGLTFPYLKTLCVKHPPHISMTEILTKVNALKDGLREAIDNPGNCCLVYMDEDSALSAKDKLTSNPLYQDVIVGFAKATNFPCERNNVHICTESSTTSYCICIKSMISDICSLLKEIKTIEQSECKAKVEEAQKINKLQYAHHSLLMESIQVIPENVKNIVDASQYAVDNIDNISLKYILRIHKLVNPDISNVGMFRTQEIYVFGIYGTRIFDETTLPPEPHLVVPQIKKVIKLIKSSLNTVDMEAVIIAAMQASTDFVITHPFSDGNGRCSRILLGSILRKYGFPWVTIPLTDKTRYFEALELLRSTKNYTLIYRFLCRCIYRSMKLYLQNLQS